MVDRLADGTRFFAPIGSLPVSDDGQRVQCHLCGRWYRLLSGSHLQRAHGWTSEAYRETFGLAARHALQAPALSARQAAHLKTRIRSDPRVRAGMRKGAAIARSGELARQGRDASARTARRAERRAGQVRSGQARGAAARAPREQIVRAAGFADLRSYLVEHHLRQGISVTELARRLAVRPDTVVADLARFGIPRHPVSTVGLQAGQATLARRRASRRARLEDRARELGARDLRDYLRRRYLLERAPALDLARELEINRSSVYALLAANGYSRRKTGRG